MFQSIMFDMHSLNVQPNLQTLGHVQPPPFEMDTLDTLETSLLLATGSASSPKNHHGTQKKVHLPWTPLKVYFSYVSGMEEEKKSIMEKPQKMLIGMMRLSFGFFWLVFQDVNLHIRWLPLCTLGISHGALGWFIPQNCAGEVWNFEGSIISQRIHGTGIFTHIYHKIQPNVGRKYTSHIDPMGLDSHKHSAKVGILQQKLHGFLKVFLQTVCEAVDAKRACRDIKIMFVWFSVFSFPRSLFWGCGDEVTDVRYHSQKLNSSPPKNDG